jgi:hypothetical protein
MDQEPEADPTAKFSYKEQLRMLPETPTKHSPPPLLARFVEMFVNFMFIDSPSCIIPPPNSNALLKSILQKTTERVVPAEA